MVPKGPGLADVVEHEFGVLREIAAVPGKAHVPERDEQVVRLPRVQGVVAALQDTLVDVDLRLVRIHCSKRTRAPV